MYLSRSTVCALAVLSTSAFASNNVRSLYEDSIEEVMNMTEEIMEEMEPMDEEEKPFPNVRSFFENILDMLGVSEEQIEEIEEDINPCAGKKPKDPYFDDAPCYDEEGNVVALEQAGENVTKGYQGRLQAVSREPISVPYRKAGLCPVNVHWHLGTEHYSLGEYDEAGSGPHNGERTLEEGARLGFQCNYFDAEDPKFTTPYQWEHCVDMEVGETYEVHWPHSAAGMCNSPWQYQTPFYDGVFCTDGVITLDPLNTYMKIGVQAQVFTIVNDEDYYYDDLFSGMIVDGEMGTDLDYYTGSTTGTTRDNEVCSKWSPITWQVDRKCHIVSASSFDKMCHDMKMQLADMSEDLYPHGSRELVADQLSANNHGGRERY